MCILPLRLLFGLTGNRPQSAPACSLLHYNKCGYACSLKHLKSLHTFVLADSFLICDWVVNLTVFSSLSSFRQEIYCPHCKRMIKVDESSDSTMNRSSYIRIAVFCIPITLFGYIGYWENSRAGNSILGPIIGFCIFGLFINLFLASSILSIGSKQCEIEGPHGIS